MVLQAEGRYALSVTFVSSFRAPAGVVAESQEVAIFISHLSWDADLVAVEVVGLLAAFSVFDDVVYIGETAYVRTAHTLRQN